MLSKSEIKAAIEKAPAVADVVKKLASKVARGVRLPARYSVKNLILKSATYIATSSIAHTVCAQY